MTTPFPGNRWDQGRAADLSKPEPAKENESPAMTQAEFFKKPAKTPEQVKKEQSSLVNALRNRQ